MQTWNSRKKWRMMNHPQFSIHTQQRTTINEQKKINGNGFKFFICASRQFFRTFKKGKELVTWWWWILQKISNFYWKMVCNFSTNGTNLSWGMELNYNRHLWSDSGMRRIFNTSYNMFLVQIHLIYHVIMLTWFFKCYSSVVVYRLFLTIHSKCFYSEMKRNWSKKKYYFLLLLFILYRALCGS